MKKTMNRINKKLAAILFLSLSLSFTAIACDQGDGIDRSTAHGRGIAHARDASESTHREYFKCYALSVEEKEKCMERLTKKYLMQPEIKQDTQDPEFVKGFQYESEKLGFQRYLELIGYTCEGIKDGPEFSEDKKAYLVRCKNKEYLMEFDYKSKGWNLKK